MSDSMRPSIREELSELTRERDALVAEVERLGSENQLAWNTCDHAETAGRRATARATAAEQRATTWMETAERLRLKRDAAEQQLVQEKIESKALLDAAFVELAECEQQRVAAEQRVAELERTVKSVLKKRDAVLVEKEATEARLREVEAELAETRAKASIAARCDGCGPKPCATCVRAEDIDDRARALFAALCEGDGEHSEALDLAIIRAHVSDAKAQAEQTAAGWESTAREMANGLEFYRDIVQQTGAHFGPAAYTSDDGSVQDSVLALKVPELAAQAVQTAAGLREALEKYGDHLDTCAVVMGWGQNNPCTCGLDAALHGQVARAVELPPPGSAGQYVSDLYPTPKDGPNCPDCGMVGPHSSTCQAAREGE